MRSLRCNHNPYHKKNSLKRKATPSITTIISINGKSPVFSNYGDLFCKFCKEVIEKGNVT